MRLSDFEADCLVLSNAGHLAQRRLARGLRLNYPESVALISSQVRHSLNLLQIRGKFFIFFSNIVFELRFSSLLETGTL